VTSVLTWAITYKQQVIPCVIAACWMIRTWWHYARKPRLLQSRRVAPMSWERAAVFDRARHRCEHRVPWTIGLWRCRRQQGLQVDHHRARSRRGSNTLKNYRALCHRHNLAKSDNLTIGQRVGVTIGALGPLALIALALTSCGSARPAEPPTAIVVRALATVDIPDPNHPGCTLNPWQPAGYECPRKDTATP
jgi:hypothetical protein